MTVALAGNLIGEELVTHVALTGELILIASVQYSKEGWGHLMDVEVERV